MIEINESHLRELLERKKQYIDNEKKEIIYNTANIVGYLVTFYSAKDAICGLIKLLIIFVAFLNIYVLICSVKKCVGKNAYNHEKLYKDIIKLDMRNANYSLVAIMNDFEGETANKVLLQYYPPKWNTYMFFSFPTADSNDEENMLKCIELARMNLKGNQYPIGAIITDDSGKIIAASNSSLRKTFDPTNHPEIEVIRLASEIKQTRFLIDCFLFTTLEPCPMCTSAAIWAKMKGIIYGACQEDAIEFVKGNDQHQLSWRQITVKSKDIIRFGNPTIELYEGLMREECKKLFI